MKYNILITGANGFIGRNLVEFLEKRGHNIICVTRNRTKTKYSTITYEDLFNNTVDLPQIDYVYNLASVGVVDHPRNIVDYCEVNTNLAIKLAQFFLNKEIKLFIQFGSCFEYGNHMNKVLSEETICLPNSAYAISKYSTTLYFINVLKKVGLPFIIVRPFNVFGKYESYTRLVPAIFLAGLNQQKIKLSKGTQIRDFSDVKDVVECIYLLTESKKLRIGEIYNICSNNPISVYTFVNEIITLCNFDRNLFLFGELPFRLDDCMTYIGNNKKLLDAITFNFDNNHRSSIISLYNEFRGGIHEQK